MLFIAQTTLFLLAFAGVVACSLGMIYFAGAPDHKQDNAGMIDHIIELVQQRAEKMRGANG